MFLTLVLVIHVIVCIALILIILLQTGKGADIGAVFGGGSSQTVFGSTGATTFLSKVTIVAAVAFMITSIILTYFSGRGITVSERSIVSEQPAATAPVTTPAPSAPIQPTEIPKSEQSGTQSAPAKESSMPATAPTSPAGSPSSSEKPAENK